MIAYWFQLPVLQAAIMTFCALAIIIVVNFLYGPFTGAKKTWALKFGSSDGRQLQKTAYEQGRTADEAITAFRKRLPDDQWIIFSVEEVDL